MRILIIEDEKEFVDLLVLRLEGAGHKAMAALDGKDGFEKARSAKPDLIILDLGLPKVDGYWVCDLLKKDRKFSDIPVIVITARSGKETRDFAMQCGADKFIEKPFESEELLKAIDAIFKNK